MSWLRFKKKMVKCLNHKLQNEVLLQPFYRSLDASNTSMANIIAKGSQMYYTYDEASIVLDHITRMNRALHTKEDEVVSSASIRKLSKEETLREEAQDKKMAQLMTHIEVFSKHLMGTPT